MFNASGAFPFLMRVDRDHEIQRDTLLWDRSMSFMRIGFACGLLRWKVNPRPVPAPLASFSRLILFDKRGTGRA